MAVLERKLRGKKSYLQGRLAEERVSDFYLAKGAELLATRWRGVVGEIDLILKHRGVVVFVEVKSSSSIARAAQALSARQQLRIMAAAEEYIGGLPTGLMTDMRVDVALVAGNEIDVIEAALGL